VCSFFFEAAFSKQKIPKRKAWQGLRVLPVEPTRQLKVACEKAANGGTPP
jgi:hypothetical protein